MYLFFRRTKIFRLTLAAFFLISATHVTAIASNDEEDSPVGNVRVDRQGRVNIFIEYDLNGEPSDVFTVTLTIKVLSDSAYAYIPLNVIGDIGANIKPGKNKRISWRVADEHPPTLDQDDVQFVVAAIPPPSSGGASAELYIAGGAAVVGLAVAIAILSSGKSDSGPVNSEFPAPPGRPR